MSKITYPNKATGDTFSGTEATEIKTIVNTNDDELIALSGEVDLNTAKDGITTEQSNEITANTSKVGITPAQASDIVANNDKISYTDSAEVAVNTAKVGITTQQATDITTNNSKINDVIAGTNVTIDKTDPLNPIISSEGGGTGSEYTSIAAAMAVDPLPANNTPFIVRGSGGADDGYYIYDSNEVGGYFKTGEFESLDLTQEITLGNTTQAPSSDAVAQAIGGSGGGAAQEWVAQPYEIGTYAVRNGYMYLAVADTLGTDEPNFGSPVWKVKQLDGSDYSTINPIDIQTITRGKEFTGTNGEIVDDVDRFITNYIPIDLETVYVFGDFYGSFINKVQWYDANFNWLRGATQYTDIRTTNANEVYFRYDTPNYLLGVNQLFINKKYSTETGVRPIDWIGYDLSLNNLYEKDELIKEVIGDNLFDYENMIDAVANETNVFIDVVGDEWYAKTDVLGVDFYDNTDALVGSVSTAYQVKAPTNAVKCKLTFTLIDANLFSDIFFKRGYAINENDISRKYKQYVLGDNIIPILEKGWCHIGDSISIDRGDGTNYPYWVQKSLNFRNFKNTAVSGTTSSDYAIGDDYYKVAANDDVVTVNLGTNDQGFNIPIATFTTNMQTLYDRIRTTNPTAVIGFITLLRRNTGTNALGLTTEPYRDAIIDFCALNAIKCLDIWNESGLNPLDATNQATWFSDNTHPNSSAHELMLSPLVNEWIKSLVRT